MTKLILVAAASAALAGCASTPVNAEKTASPEAPMRAAEEMGANHVPQAALELQLARDQTEQAKQLIKAGDKEKSDMLLQRAEADAELALALAKEAPLVAEAKIAQEQVKALRQSNASVSP